MVQLTKGTRSRLKAEQVLRDQHHIHKGVDFSRIQIPTLLQQAKENKLEFEALGPYMTDYSSDGYRLAADILTPEDLTGLRLNQLFRQLFPSARVVSLYDDYNKTHATEDDGTLSAQYAESDRVAFRTSLKQLFIDKHIAANETDMLLLPESGKVVQAKQLVAELDRLGLIQRNGLEIAFTPRSPERLFYDKVVLRTKRGKWLCVALDAAGFLHQDNRAIVHLVALPDYMKEQQDKAWEILRVLAISPERYHNIFYSPQDAPHHVVKVVQDAFQSATYPL